ncbi:EF-G C-terminal domain-like protein, partial [Caulochytrium protostelioides]
GFRWATQEGPLLDGVLRHTKFRLLRADLAPELMYRPGGQIIPLARRVCYAAFLTATPRLLEPLLRVEVMAPPSALEVVYAVLSRRRGHATAERPKPGTPLTRVHALVPAIDMPGFETDLRAMTHGAAAVQMMFSHWQAVPGDPLDRDITIRPLEASTGPRLAKDFMLKTRRRKGLPETIGMAKFFDDAMMQQLVEHDIHLESS